MVFTPFTILIFIAFGISMFASFKVERNFKEFSSVQNDKGLTGYQVARKILDDNGLWDVPIEAIPGKLSDHYDPVNRVVRLSEGVYHESSVSAISVAAHECGHVIQHKESYPMLVLRHRIFPVVNFSSGIAPLLLLGGILLKFSGLILIGILLFSIAVFFQLITLPVEFDASNKAKRIMVENGYINNHEEKGVSKVLNAAALTYVAATLMSVLQLAEYVWIFKQNEE